MSDYNFDGFSADTFKFFQEIKENNNKAWFDANKKRFKQSVQTPAQAFVVTLGEKLVTLTDSIQYDVKLNGSGSIMRIYRDVRFSKDKTPYKTNLGIVWWEGEGKKTEAPGFYFHMSADELWMGGGLYMFPKDFLPKYRAAVIDDELGGQLEHVIAELGAMGYAVNGDQYARVPRGFDKEHPRAELLRYKGLTTGSGQLRKEEAFSAEFVNTCFAHCQNIALLQQWLAKVSRSAL